MARELIKYDAEFDVVHLEHLKPGQLEEYSVVYVPATSTSKNSFIDHLGVGKQIDARLYISPDDMEFIKEQEDFIKERLGVGLRAAWADSEEVDVIQRYYGPPVEWIDDGIVHEDGTHETIVMKTGGDGPCVLSIVNRGKKEFDSRAHFLGGEESLQARIGPVAIGFVSVEDGSIRGAVIDHEKGLGEVVYKDDRLAFTGTYATIVNEKGYSLVSALDDGNVTIQSILAVKPLKIVRIYIDGRTEEALFTYDEKSHLTEFDYDAGSGAERTDMYVMLGEGVTLQDAIGDYLRRTGGN